MFYLMEVTTYTDGTPKGKALYEYQTKTDVLAAFHKKLGGAMGNAKYESELVKAVTYEGIEVATYYWEREKPEEEEPNG